MGRIPAGFFKRSLDKIPEMTGLISKVIAALGTLVEIFEESSREIPIGNSSRFFCKNTYGALQKIPGWILRRIHEKTRKISYIIPEKILAGNTGEIIEKILSKFYGIALTNFCRNSISNEGIFLVGWVKSLCKSYSGLVLDVICKWLL